MNTAEFIQIRKFIVKLGIMLHKYGTPAFRLEAYLTELATYLGVRASFIATPTALTFVIWSDRREDEYNHSVRVQPGDYDMNALSRTDELATRLLAGEVGLEEADHQLDVINQMPSPYGKILTGLGFCGATGAFAMLMGASWQEILWTSLIGLVVYFLVLWSQISRRVTLMLEPAASLVAGLIACAISFYFDHGINIPLVVLSSVIILVPGLALTMGLAELSTRNLVSGTARVMDAVMQLFKLYFGAFLGISIGFGLFGPNESQVATSLPEWSRWFAILMLCLALVVIFRTRFKHIPWALLSGFIAYGATVWSASYIDQGLSTFVGAFALGIYANLFTRIAHAPASLVSMQGLIVLVPGSKTYIGLNSFVSGQDFVQAEHIGQETFLIFMSLIAGLIFANVVMPTKKAL
ncbi:threonine/serine exporter family protein [Paraglaciecola chathamensis]|uniref:threonine/serine ThrE exporter family protein n=1 Tax=Paraglaciecola chathamensis TaxID=368405 RepID=UPI002700F469|nr:threonine/serine exporter family protein [Paraglaciecola chathamensis]MDO6561001.1 threonine/serine exporter family protein [Paraglaciecola chathamensis]